MRGINIITTLPTHTLRTLITRTPHIRIIRRIGITGMDIIDLTRTTMAIIRGIGIGAGKGKYMAECGVYVGFGFGYTYYVP
jgi:hypothetical protein